ncbi:MAG: SCP2 sterol-binding domain-containing protein [Acidimicrobiia bacterium]|nr:SCP2 sterol-binding domain-containing protein [Acidimicrobiia bacterium]
MVEFLSPDWLAALESASDRRTRARAAGPAESEHGEEAAEVTVDHVVPDAPRGRVHYRLRIDTEGVHVESRPVGTADLTVETDFATAVRLHRGDWNAQDAAASGHLKMSGQVGVLRERRELLTGLGDVFQELRASTTIPER